MYLVQQRYLFFFWRTVATHTKDEFFVATINALCRTRKDGKTYRVVDK